MAVRHPVFVRTGESFCTSATAFESNVLHKHDGGWQQSNLTELCQRPGCHPDGQAMAVFGLRACTKSWDAVNVLGHHTHQHAVCCVAGGLPCVLGVVTKRAVRHRKVFLVQFHHDEEECMFDLILLS